MKRDTPLLVAGLTQGLTSAASLGFYVAVRPSLLEEYHHHGLQMSVLTELFLGTPCLAWVGAGALVVSLTGLLSPLGRGSKLRLVGATIVLSGFAFVAAALGSFGPLL
jgi:hypothetical protein